MQKGTENSTGLHVKFLDNHLNLAVHKDAREEVAGEVSKIFAGIFLLHLKMQNIMWNQKYAFQFLYTALEIQNQELMTALNALAERIQILGGAVPGTLKQLQVLPEKLDKLHETSEEIIEDVISENRGMISILKMAIEIAKNKNDGPSVELLVHCLGMHEKNIWMLTPN